MTDNDVLLYRLSHPCKAVVISGGEPLLQQRELLNLLGGLKKKDYWIEIETNGTIVPQRMVLELVDQINCSPKLSNSGDSKAKRVQPKALEALVASEKVFFKFVVGSPDDMDEVLEYVNDYFIPPQRVYLMPLGKTKKELAVTSELVRKLAVWHNFIYSSRLHVELWGTVRGV